MRKKPLAWPDCQPPSSALPQFFWCHKRQANLAAVTCLMMPEAFAARASRGEHEGMQGSSISGSSARTASTI
jgi:hypothetical protein